MKTRQLACLLCSLCAATVLATSPASEIPVWLRFAGNPHPSSLEVFNAFHTKEGPTNPAPNVQGPFLEFPPAVYPNEFRDVDGSRNNPARLGAAGGVHLRTTTVGYGDGVGSPGGADRLSPREISNLVMAQSDLIPNTDSVSSFVRQWGQFVD